MLRAQAEGGAGPAFAEMLGSGEPDDLAPDGFSRRFLALGFEACRRGEISRRKLIELAGMVNVARDAVDGILGATGLAGADDGGATETGWGGSGW
jgi:hypothetical protein